ncbi:MAG TPA: putative zinc-binding metallopeptidase [Thermoanaerobaculia bacterium]|nr:putative zinc-binding metallopeptidase [Thermoanaerobaculia bacterium]
MVVAFEKAPPEARELLPIPIRELGLRLEGTPLAAHIEKLYGELEAKGVRHFRPACYLSDQWGCPSGQPVIGIPFYLADRRLAAIENAVNDIEDEREIMMYLRHEAGHAFNYAYELYRTPEWREMFGPFRRPYRDDYPFVPFSRDHVRHIGGWYAQKHPDEDFAETFAVWLDPNSRWAERYRGWGAMRKLLYVDRVALQMGDCEPLHAVGEADLTVDEMEQSVEEFYRSVSTDESAAIGDLAIDTDLTAIFVEPQNRDPSRAYRSAALLLAEHRRDIVDKVNDWGGVRRSLVRTLVLAIERRLEELQLFAEVERSRTQMIEITVYIASLAMTFLARGKVVRHRRPGER